jgi:alkanesulfonate monooxygenase SsuD/methylene tetrahydromethanopterin reductase-like flavin-dependent oxidoreductase (luciferase family)
MRFGIVILQEHRWTEARRMWQAAEELGFHHAWTYDHIGWRDLVEGPWFDAVPTLTAAATVTSRIHLGTHVASANFRHPAAFAREIMALDDISNGRFLLGIGAGGKGFDSTVLGQSELSGRERVDRFTEFVSLLHQILRNDRTTYDGRYFSAVDARRAPGPLRGEIPFIVAANAPRSTALAARYGDGWITTGTQTESLQRWWSAVGENCRRFEDALDREGRSSEAIPRYLSLDAAPVYSLSSVDAFADAVGRARELGFTDVVSHWPRPSGWYAGDEAILNDVAASHLRSTPHPPTRDNEHDRRPPRNEFD